MAPPELGPSEELDPTGLEPPASESLAPAGLELVPLELASLDTLVVRHAAAGLDVMVDVSGEPRPLGGTADQSAYRILQEALTNAARHGGGRARIEVVYCDAAVELTVTNPVVASVEGSVADAGPPRSGGGHGLIGMRERATLLGGDFEAGCVDGVFRVRARIPHGGHRG